MDPLNRPVRPIQHRRRPKPLSVEIRDMYKVLSVTVLLLAMASTTAYLYTNSLKPAKGYTLQELNLQNGTLSSEQRKLDHELIEAQSFINIEDSEKLFEMEEASMQNFQYVDDNGYASR